MTVRAGRCAWCQQPLAGSPSDWWCSEAHQRWWTRARNLRLLRRDGERTVDLAALSSAAVAMSDVMQQVGRAAQPCSRTLGQIIQDTWVGQRSGRR